MAKTIRIRFHALLRSETCAKIILNEYQAGYSSNLVKKIIYKPIKGSSLLFDLAQACYSENSSVVDSRHRAEGWTNRREGGSPAKGTLMGSLTNQQIFLIKD